MTYTSFFAHRTWLTALLFAAALQIGLAAQASCVYNLSDMSVYTGLDCGVFCLHIWNTEPGQPVCAPGVGGTLHILNGYVPLVLPDEAGLNFEVDPHGYVAIFRENPDVVQFCNYQNDDTLLSCKTANPDQLNPAIP